MSIFHDELQKFNRTLNLVSAKTLPFSDVIHFADSILACQLIYQDNPQIPRLFDLGSGNGFPGLIWAILYPKTKVSLVDADQRKCEFLKHTASTLQLSNVDILSTSIESLEANSVTHCISRGLSSISRSILLTRRIVPVNGAFYHLKGETWAAEVGEIPTQLCSVWSPSLIGEYKLPIGPMKFAVVKTDKIS